MQYIEVPVSALPAPHNTASTLPGLDIHARLSLSVSPFKFSMDIHKYAIEPNIF